MVIFLIERYEIVKDGNEEILIIYLNYKYEFSKDFINFENEVENLHKYHHPPIILP